MYYKGKWCTAGGKDPLFGHVDGFQIDPNKMISSFYSAVPRQTAWAAVRNVLTSFLAAVAAGRNPAA